MQCSQNYFRNLWNFLEFLSTTGALLEFILQQTVISSNSAVRTHSCAYIHLHNTVYMHACAPVVCCDCSHTEPFYRECELLILYVLLKLHTLLKYTQLNISKFCKDFVFILSGVLLHFSFMYFWYILPQFRYSHFASSFRVLWLLRFVPQVRLIMWTVIKSLEVRTHKHTHMEICMHIHML